MLHLPPLAAIVAMDVNRVIGHQGSLPWHHPEDLKFFKATTLGHPILMGRATFESIGRPLPGRQNIVLSRSLPTAGEGVTLIRSLDDLAGSVVGTPEKLFVIGGAQLFETLLPRCSELYLTFIDATHPGDVYLPPFEHLFTQAEVLRHSPPLEFRRYVKNPAPAA